MEIITSLVSALFGGAVAWLITRWQYNRQAADMREQLLEQARLTQAQGREDVKLRIQVEKYQELRRFDDGVGRHLIEIDHNAGHLIVDPSEEYYREDFCDRLREARRMIRGESEDIGEELAKSLLDATDLWAHFLTQPQESRQLVAADMSLDALRLLRELINDRGRRLGVGL